MEKSEFKKFRIKSPTCYYFDDITKLQDFHIDNILMNQNSHKNF